MKTLPARTFAIWAAVLVVLVCSVATVPRSTLTPVPGSRGTAAAGEAAHPAVCLVLRAAAPVLSMVALAPELSLAERAGLHAVHALLEQIQAHGCAAEAAPRVPGEPLPADTVEPAPAADSTTPAPRLVPADVRGVRQGAKNTRVARGGAGGTEARGPIQSRKMHRGRYGAWPTPRERRRSSAGGPPGCGRAGPPASRWGAEKQEKS